MSFTPGPWVVAEKRLPNSSLRQLYVHAADPAASKESGYRSVPAHLCVGYAGAGENAERENANAALIAAAPDLLAALEELLAARNGGNGRPSTSLLGIARAAIKKARGGK